MRTTIRSTLATLCLAPLFLTLAAQGPVVDGRPAPARDRILPATVSFNSSLTPAEEARLARMIDASEVMVVEGRYAEARTVLRQVVADQEKGGAYTAPALRRLANVEFGMGRPLAAARVLEKLADAAQRVGDPQTEITALVDALILYSQQGRHGAADQLRPRIRGLLDSPAISEETRRSIARHLKNE